MEFDDQALIAADRDGVIRLWSRGAEQSVAGAMTIWAPADEGDMSGGAQVALDDG